MFSFSSLLPSAAAARILLTLLLALRLPAAAQGPTWQAARAVAVATTAAATNTSQVKATAVDAQGNVYLAGYFSNSVVLGNTTLTSAGNNDAFVAKFNSASNQFVWALRAGGASYDELSALAVSGSNLYVAGFFTGPTADFGATTLTSFGVGDAVVAKITDAGSTASFGWAQRAGGGGYDAASALTVRGTSVYVTGRFGSTTASFGTTTLTNVSSNGVADLFVAKLTDLGSTGSFSWAQSAGGTAIDEARALAVQGTSIYVAGRFSSPTVSFGATTLTSVNPDGTTDAFVAKLTDAGSAGSFAWAQSVGGMGADEASALAVTGTGVYVAGAFSSPTLALGTTTLTNAGTVGFDVFVAKLTDAGSAGSFAWAQRAGGEGGDFAYALAASGTSLYVAGIFDSSAAGFGSATLGSAGGYDVFVAKLTDPGSAGSFAWAQRAGGTGDDNTGALVLSGTSVYVGGAFSNPSASFGPVTLSNADPNTSLGFLASLTDPTLTATAPGRALAPVQLFPNPAHHTATLRMPAGTAPAALTLTDPQGRVVRRYFAPTGAEATLDLRGLAAGLYLLRAPGLMQRLVVE